MLAPAALSALTAPRACAYLQTPLTRAERALRHRVTRKDRRNVLPGPTMQPHTNHIRSFYEAAVLGLRALDARPGRGRRFGPGPDARWKLFAGHLQDVDRVDLIVRDAAASHPLGFAPRAIFGLAGLADDEPFGPDWPGAEPASTHRLLRDDAAPPADLATTLERAGGAWGAAPAGLPLGALETAGPASRVVLSGVGAILAAARFFEGRSGFDFADQVVLVTDRPAERQIFGLAGALLDTTGSLRALGSAGLAVAWSDASLGHPDAVVLSSDADPRTGGAVRDLGAGR